MAVTVVESATFSPSSGKSRSLYIHIPFCRHRCGYCNFALLANREDLIDRYLDALGTEISWLQNRPRVTSVFLGGGTPSLLKRKQLEATLDLIHERFDIDSNVEMTIECNPDDVNSDFCESLLACGFNRVSLGVQSFDEAKLKLLDREHSRREIRNAVSILQENFSNVSFDLMFAAPAEQLDDWLHDLETAIEMRPDHLSTYELTIEKGTAFWNRQYHGSLQVPDEDSRAELFEATIGRLRDAHFRHYEISSFARVGKECRHNQTYWDGSDYLAFGASAARFVDGVRETNHRSTTTYMKRVFDGQTPVFEQETVAGQNRTLERIAFGLRRIAGIDWAALEFELASLPDPFVKKLTDKLDNFKSLQLLSISQGKCRLSQRGLLLYDSIASQLLALGGVD